MSDTKILQLRLDVHLHHEPDTVTTALLNQILAKLSQLETKEVTMSVQLDTLAAQVAATTEVEKSAITLIQGLSAQIAALKDDPAKLQALADSLSASAADLSAAITANTPAAPPAPPPAA